LDSQVEANVTAKTLGVIINRADPLSVKIGKYYQKRRRIPSRNLIYTSFDPDKIELSVLEFDALKQEVEAGTPSHIQAYALTWVKPYRVNCRSITSAFALSSIGDNCGCDPTPANPYFNSKTSTPHTTFGMRPTMAIAATTFAEAKALIERGVAADNTRPSGTAYLMSTDDQPRNVRARLYPETLAQLSHQFSITVIEANTLVDRQDVMFYFTGLARVKNLETNRFLPGAVADHLTSSGGVLTGGRQMSALAWLKAGATASYGTVQEPCNHLQKFPHPGVMIYHYLAGDTVVEAYWKSVFWPSQGIFVGEPLARPFGDALGTVPP